VRLRQDRAPVAQLDRASDYGSEGREFESLRAHLEKMGRAPVAELVDALDSGSSGRKPVEVRVLSGALRSNIGRCRCAPGSTGRAAQVLKLVDRPD
jgi:hypothetical protein